MTHIARAARTLAQAKLNLGLRVLGRAPSGYHDLETLFHQVELADEVQVARTGGERALACTGAIPRGGLGPARENLAWRAAAAYAAAAGWDGGFSVELVKRIPAGGGLGGGSSDAGAVLRSCERLASRPIGQDRLMEIAAELGSDVPFLAGESPAAHGRGRGERLQPVAPLPPRDVALVFPAFGIPTQSAYSWLADSRSDRSAPHAQLEPKSPVTWDGLATDAINDFEPVVASRHPGIADIVRALREAGAEVAMMSGSGSTVFGVFAAHRVAHARHKLRSLPDDVTTVWTRTAQRVVPVELSG